MIESADEEEIPEVAEDDFDMQELENDLEETFRSRWRNK